MKRNTKMKKFFLTLDLEEWYHLEYVKGYKDKMASNQRFVPKVIPFLRDMANKDIHMTVFVLADIAEENSQLIKEIAGMGHEIACHGLGHELVYNLSIEEFREKTKKAKQLLENITGRPVIGYRAPCFSMEDEKLGILWELGFAYDASLIRFKEHKLYNVLNISDYKKVESMIYKKENNYEFETPTLDIIGKSIPISGGGYFRLFPLCLMKWFMKRHWNMEDNFIFYIHPFEIVSERLINANKMKFKDFVRFQIGRPRLHKKLNNYLIWLKKHDVRFVKFENFISNEVSRNERVTI